MVSTAALQTDLKQPTGKGQQIYLVEAAAAAELRLIS
jgi:hypothetical protein